MPYHRLLYHFVWATKDRLPLVDKSIRGSLYGAIIAKVRELGALFYALNGTEDHVHLVVDLPPALAPAAFVGQVKGASSHLVAKLGTPFAWQAEYGVVTFSESTLPSVVAYVNRQQQHHATGTTRDRLEA